MNTNEETQHNVPVLTSPKRAPRETKNLSTLFNMLDIKNIPKMEMHSRTSMYIVYTHTHENRYTTLWLRDDGSFLLLPYTLYTYGCDPYFPFFSILRMIKKERKKSQVIGNELIFCVCIIYPCGTGMTFDSWVQAFSFSQGCHFYFIFFLNIETFFLFPHPKFFEVCSFWFCSVLFFVFSFTSCRLLFLTYLLMVESNLSDAGWYGDGVNSLSRPSPSLFAPPGIDAMIFPGDDGLRI